MDLSIFYSKEFQDAFINETPLIKRDVVNPQITWDMAFKAFDEYYQAGNAERMGTKVRPDFGFKVRRASMVPELKEIIDELYNIFEVSDSFSGNSPWIPDDAHQFYISLTTAEGSYGSPHIDPENVIFLQGQGIVNWKIWDKDKKEVEVDEILNPGDLIYCPPGRLHHVLSITPRFGISLGYGKLKKIEG